MCVSPKMEGGSCLSEKRGREKERGPEREEEGGRERERGRKSKKREKARERGREREGERNRFHHQKPAGPRVLSLAGPHTTPQRAPCAPQSLCPSPWDHVPPRGRAASRLCRGPWFTAVRPGTPVGWPSALRPLSVPLPASPMNRLDAPRLLAHPAPELWLWTSRPGRTSFSQ